jgi:lysophospholipase L1-like esterase
MNSIFSRTLKALCTLAVVGLLSACGSSSTVDPFNPTRVIGLGDGFNDANATVRETGSTTGTVAGQLAANFGQTNIVSKASAGAQIADLAAQIDDVVANNGSFSSGDLVVITIGMFDVKAGPNKTPDERKTDANLLVAQVQRILDLGATHVFIMPVLELSRTPWGRGNGFSTTATGIFNDAVNPALSRAFGSQRPNPVIYANASNVTSSFLIATSTTPYSPFTDTGYNGTVAGTTPACGDATVFAGCDAVNANASYATMLFADGIHLTPAGNRWIAGILNSAMRTGSWI